MWACSQTHAQDTPATKKKAVRPPREPARQPAGAKRVAKARQLAVPASTLRARTKPSEAATEGARADETTAAVETGAPSTGTAAAAPVAPVEAPGEMDTRDEPGTAAAIAATATGAAVAAAPAAPLAQAARAAHITNHQKGLICAYLALHYNDWGGCWPRSGPAADDAARACEEAGVSVEQARRQLANMRVERGDVGRRGGGDSSSSADVRKAEYAAMLLGTLDKAKVIVAAYARAAKSRFVDAQPQLRVLLARVRLLGGTTHAMEQLLDALAASSAEAHARGATDGPVAYALRSVGCDLPAFRQSLLATFVSDAAAAATLEADGFTDAEPSSLAAAHDIRRLASLLFDAAREEYAAALELNEKPTIDEPPLTWELPGALGEGQLASIYNIAAYLLHTVVTKLAPPEDDGEIARWARDLVSCCSLPARDAEEKRLPISKVKSRSRGGLLYPCTEFYTFAFAIEKIYLFNLTDAKMDAYPSNLTSLIYEKVRSSEGPRYVMEALVRPCLPVGVQDKPVPEEFYALVYHKYRMLRCKDLAKAIDRAHASERSVSATAANITHRANLASVSAAAAAKRAKSSVSDE